MSNRRTRCQSCGHDNPFWTELDRSRELFRCGSCNSFSFLGNLNTKASDLYGGNYFAGEEYLDYIGHEKSHEKNSIKKWRLLSPYLPRPLKLLELGCAHGFFVDFVRRQGDTAFGVDVSADAISYARNRFGPWFVQAGEDFVPSSSFNCLMAWDVWEHLSTPFDTFSRLLLRLPPGGIAVFTTLDSSSLVARFRGLKWRQVHPPTHLHYPTAAALRASATRLGLEVLDQGHYGSYRALDSYLKPFHLDSRLAVPAAIRHFPIPLNLGDEQYLIARRRPV